jgi:hypothetical protein
MILQDTTNKTENIRREAIFFFFLYEMLNIKIHRKMYSKII